MSKPIIIFSLLFLTVAITQAQDAPEGWVLVWNDEFDGPDIDESKWSFEIGNNNGWGNNELEYYTRENAFIQDGNLVIQANQEEKEGFQYTSSRMKTQGKYSVVYGMFEASIKLPVGQGMWPAFWMLGENIAQVGWPACGEIDIMEWVGYDPNNVHGSTHGPGFDTTNAFSSDAGFSNDFHKYTAVWQPDFVQFSVDDQVYATITPANTNGQPFVFNNNPMFLLLNLAVGGNWPGSPDGSTQFPQQMVVEWVRVYEKTFGGDQPTGDSGETTPTPVDTPASKPEDAPEGWALVWNDEFDGQNIDESKWSFEIGNNNGWGNNELEYYTKENAFIQDGNLVIQANKEEKEGFEYTSSRMKTQGKYSVVYGMFEASIKLPVGQGMWPAFWMLGENIAQVGWPACGEIDIMEWVGYDPNNVHGSTHGPGFDTTNTFSSDAGFSNDFHKYTAVWQPDFVQFSVDDQVYATITPANTNGAPFVFNDNPMFILLNLAVGGNWPGSPDDSTQFPQQMVVDWVRVYEKINGGQGSDTSSQATTVTTPGKTIKKWVRVCKSKNAAKRRI